MVQYSLKAHPSCGAVPTTPQCRRARFCSRLAAVRCFKDNSDETSAGPLRLNFKLPYRVNFGQSVGLVGSGDTLGNWDPKRRIPMKWTDGDWWIAEVSVAPGTPTLDLEYKYVIVNADGNISYWKPGNNYRVTLPLQPTNAKVLKRVKVADAWDESFKKIDLEEVESVPSAASSSGSSSPLQGTLPGQLGPQQLGQQHEQGRQQPTTAAAATSPLSPQLPTATAAGAPGDQQSAPSTSQPATDAASMAASNGSGVQAAPLPPAEQPTTSNGVMPAAGTTSSSTQQHPPQQPLVGQQQQQLRQAEDEGGRGPAGLQASTPPPQPPRVGQLGGVPPSFAAATCLPSLHPALMAEEDRLQDVVRSSLEDLQQQVDMHQQLRKRTDDPAAPEVLVADRIVAAANNRVVAYSKALKAVQEFSRLPPSHSLPKESSPSEKSA
ncbi:hypothetical protein Agub_g796 [Astrephomene gubernaculifera]|uniref:CBM20 domain-containing protein n=1 Tax=Astrephomene gubernaculifera TaxID=47775 RepID=A0AAD3DEQ1_9CHLO|nr:hypothetical protein Agub_g796 [Astrephomene gubernaculifera]